MLLVLNQIMIHYIIIGDIVYHFDVNDYCEVLTKLIFVFDIVYTN